jgi:hypothetical protein
LTSCRAIERSGGTWRSLPVIAYGFDVETNNAAMPVSAAGDRRVPVEYRERPVGSVSKLSTFRDGFRVLFRILNVFRSYKPLTFFGGIGIVLFGLAWALGLVAIYGAAPVGSPERTWLIVLGATSLAMSLVSAGIGVIVQLVNFRFLELDSILRRRT